MVKDNLQNKSKSDGKKANFKKTFTKKTVKKIMAEKEPEIGFSGDTWSFINWLEQKHGLNYGDGFMYIVEKIWKYPELVAQWKEYKRTGALYTREELKDIYTDEQIDEYYPEIPRVEKGILWKETKWNAKKGKFV